MRSAERHEAAVKRDHGMGHRHTCREGATRDIASPVKHPKHIAGFPYLVATDLQSLEVPDRQCGWFTSKSAETINREREVDVAPSTAILMATEICPIFHAKGGRYG